MKWLAQRLTAAVWQGAGHRCGTLPPALGLSFLQSPAVSGCSLWPNLRGVRQAPRGRIAPRTTDSLQPNWACAVQATSTEN